MPNRKDRDRPEEKPKKRSPVPPPGYTIESNHRGRKEKEDNLENLLEDDLPDGPPVGMKSHTLSIVAEEIKTTALLNDTEAAHELWHRLPITGHAKLWPNEIYFEIFLNLPAEEPEDEVLPGTIAYWAEGDCFCIIIGDEPYAPVTILGQVNGDPEIFRQVEAGTEIRLTRSV